MEKYINKSNGYIFNHESGKLESFEIQSVEFDIHENSETTYNVKIGGKEQVIKRKDTFDVYNNENDFKQGHRIPDHVIKRGAILEAGFYDYSGEFKGWVSVDGRIKEIDASDCRFVLLPEKHLPEVIGYSKVYSNVEDLMEYNDLTIVESDGTERVRKSIATRMKLSTKQQEAVQMLKDALDNLEANQLEILYDGDSNNLKVFSYENAEEYEVDYEKSYEDSVEVDKHATIISSVTYYGYDDNIYMKFKED